MIREIILTTRDEKGQPHITPFGVHVEKDDLVVAPFRPSRTLDNLLREPYAVINYTDDVRVFASVVTGHEMGPGARETRPALHVPGFVLAQSLAHDEVKVERIEEDPVRPRLHCAVVHSQTHGPFHGFNRAQGAVIEAAVLMTRLDRLAREKIESEIAYLSIAIEKTAGVAEKEAWGWLMDYWARHKAGEATGKKGRS